jgi:hypothetical protein
MKLVNKHTEFHRITGLRIRRLASVTVGTQAYLTPYSAMCGQSVMARIAGLG